MSSPNTREDLRQIQQMYAELRARQPQPTHTFTPIPNPQAPTYTSFHSPSPSPASQPMSEPMRFVLHNEGSSVSQVTSTPIPITSSSSSSSFRGSVTGTPQYVSPSSPSNRQATSTSKAVLSALSDLQEKIHKLEREKSYYQDSFEGLEKENKNVASELKSQLYSLQKEVRTLEHQLQSGPSDGSMRLDTQRMREEQGQYRSEYKRHKNETTTTPSKPTYSSNVYSHTHSSKLKVTGPAPAAETPFIPGGSLGKSFSMPANIQKAISLLAQANVVYRPASSRRSPPPKSGPCTRPNCSSQLPAESFANNSFLSTISSPPTTPRAPIYDHSGVTLLQSLEEEADMYKQQIEEARDPAAFQQRVVYMPNNKSNKSKQLGNHFVIEERLARKEEQIGLLRRSQLRPVSPLKSPFVNERHLQQVQTLHSLQELQR